MQVTATKRRVKGQRTQKPSPAPRERGDRPRERTVGEGFRHIDPHPSAGCRPPPPSPAVREREVWCYSAIPSSLAAVVPRILILSASLKSGIAMMWSTGSVFHGKG